MAHAPALFAVLSDPAIYEFENEPPPSLEWLRTRFGKLESRRSPDGREQWLNWAVRLRGTSEIIGYVQATVHADASASIAYELGSAWWRRGFGSEAVRAMIAELVANHSVLRVHAVLKRANFRSARLLEKLGFSPASAEDRARLQVPDDEALMQHVCQ